MVRLLSKAGFTPVEATAFLQEEFPDVQNWTYIHMTHHKAAPAMARLVGCGYNSAGQVGQWKWERAPTRYPRFAVWGGQLVREKNQGTWTGALRVRSPEGQEFILFSYLSHRDEFCEQYLSSTDDHVLLDRFIRAVARRFTLRRRADAHVVVSNGPDFDVPIKKDEPLFLPDSLFDDIETQVRAFFENKAMFQRIGARYQRGFLFVGPPGTGKTLTIRRIIRTCHRKYRVKFFTITPKRDTDVDDIKMLFGMAENGAPAVILLDDMDSLSRETQVTRAGLLSVLDGLNSNKGILVIGTSNNAGDIDPALIQRPSRFDRVWCFPLPDADMRVRYLAHAFPTMESVDIAQLARKTGNWSYAYLNELRTTAQILAVKCGEEAVTSGTVNEAFRLLVKQFDAGRKGYVSENAESVTGFNVA